jgi:hypothetical protein
MKTCLVCEQTKDLSCFSKHKQKKDGLYPYCRECKRVKDRESYLKYADKRYESSQAWKAANPEKNKAYKKKWQDNNKHRLDDWRKANMPRVRANRSAWKKANAPKVNADTRYRQARKLQATPSWADREAMESKYRLAKFFTDLSGGFVEYHVDHIVPLRGKSVCGLHVENNLQVIKATDNFLKGNKYG